MKIKDIVIVCCIVFIVAVGLVIPVSMELSSSNSKVHGFHAKELDNINDRFEQVKNENYQFILELENKIQKEIEKKYWDNYQLVVAVVDDSKALQKHNKEIRDKILELEDGLASVADSLTSVEKQIKWDRRVLETTAEWIYEDISELKKKVHDFASVADTTLEDSIESVINNVVYVKNNTGQWQGSGVLIAPDLILTARHVTETGEDFEIKTHDGKIHKAQRAISSKKYDLGFIKLREQLPCTTVVGDISECRLGQAVYAIGSPFGEENQNSVTSGIVSSLARKLEDFGCPESCGWSVSFQTDAACEPGNSGSPIYTLDGKVRGILVGKHSSVIYCIPAILVANDCQVIQLMFLMDKYQFEEKSQNGDLYYNRVTVVVEVE